MNSALALIRELDSAVAGTTAERRADIVRRIANLFDFGAADFSAEQIDLFDDVFVRLVARIETSARAELAARLARNRSAPSRTSGLLAFDDNIEVAAPVLRHSGRLDNGMLMTAARDKSQAHLLAIAGRHSLDAIVTDVLLERGDRPVLLTTVRNAGARLSDFGFRTLVERAQGDDELATSVGDRRELPRHYLLKLLAKTSAAVRAKLVLADPLSSDAIRNAVAEVTGAILASAAKASYDYGAARAQVEALRAAGGLTDSALHDFAEAGKFEETVAALAVLSGLPVEQTERAIAGNRPETIIIMAKAIGLSRSTVRTLLTMAGGPGLSGQALDQRLGTFSRLKLSTAQQALEFQRRRAAAAAKQTASEA